MGYDRKLSMEMLQVPQPAEMYCIHMLHRENIVFNTGTCIATQHGDIFTCQILVLVASIEVLLWLTATLHLGCWGFNFGSGQYVQGSCGVVGPS